MESRGILVESIGPSWNPVGFSWNPWNPHGIHGILVRDPTGPPKTLIFLVLEQHSWIPWIPREFHGIPCNSMESHGILVESMGPSWNPVEFSWDPWNPRGIHGILVRDPTGPPKPLIFLVLEQHSWIPWIPREFHGIPCNSMESRGILVESMGPSWNPVEFSW